MVARLKHAVPAIVVTWSVLSLAGVAAALAAMTIDRTPTPSAGEANWDSLWPFWIASGSTWVGLTALWALVARGRLAVAAAVWWRVAAVVLVVAAGARLTVLLAHEPALSDDMYRYVLDGRNAVAGVNPYLITPQEQLASVPNSPAERALLERVNNPELHTVYLPLSEFVFAAIALLESDRWTDPDTAARLHRSVFTVLELVMIVLILLALARAGRSPWWAALYAWHPLALSEIAGSGHQDAIGLLLLVIVMIAAGSGTGRGIGWIAKWTVPLALAVLVKPIVIPVAAFCLRGRRLVDWAASAGIGAAVCLLVATPLWLTAGIEPLHNFLQTADRFRLKWAHFGSVYEPVLWVFERLAPGWGNDNQEVAARWICLAGVVGVTLWLWLRCHDRWSAARAMFMAMVLLSPAAHPWYVLWPLVMVPMAPGLTTWVASLTLAWGYAVLGNVEDWSVSPWVMVVAYTPVYGALVVQAYRARRGRLPDP